jgi:anti-sigma B factor antagonist
MNRSLTVEILEPSPGEVTLRMAGDIDLAADEAIADGYRRGTANGPSRIRLDFGGVRYINSTGIALIVRLLAEARRDRREVVALGLSDHYQEIFRLTRLSDYLTIVDAKPVHHQHEGARS